MEIFNKRTVYLGWIFAKIGDFCFAKMIGFSHGHFHFRRLMFRENVDYYVWISAESAILVAENGILDGISPVSAKLIR